MPTITLSALRTKLIDECWPSGYPENNLNAIKAYFIDALMDLQESVDCLKTNNLNIYPSCATIFNNWLNWFDHPQPKARVKRIWTIANSIYGNKVFFKQRNFRDILEMQRDLGRLYDLPAAATPLLSQGDRYRNTNTDSSQGRSHRGFFAIENRRIYMAPWIQSNETVYVEWNGVKSQWGESDAFDQTVWTNREEAAIKYYILWQYEDFFGDSNQAERYRKLYFERRADLINDCTKETVNWNDEGGASVDSATSDELEDEEL